MQVMLGVSLRARWDATLVNCNQETGTGNGHHKKLEPTENLEPKSNFKNICLKIFSE